jgi:hypothetical protein
MKIENFFNQKTMSLNHGKKDRPTSLRRVFRKVSNMNIQLQFL